MRRSSHTQPRLEDRIISEPQAILQNIAPRPAIKPYSFAASRVTLTLPPLRGGPLPLPSRERGTNSAPAAPDVLRGRAA